MNSPFVFRKELFDFSNLCCIVSFHKDIYFPIYNREIVKTKKFDLAPALRMFQIENHKVHWKASEVYFHIQNCFLNKFVKSHNNRAIYETLSTIYCYHNEF